MIIVTWEVDDGYAGKSRPQETVIEDWELEDCETEEERHEQIREIVQQDFENSIHWYIKYIEETED